MSRDFSGGCCWYGLPNRKDAGPGVAFPTVRTIKAAESRISYNETWVCDPQGDAGREGATVPIALLINLFLLTKVPCPYATFSSLGSLWYLLCSSVSGIWCLITAIISISMATARQFLPELSIYRKDAKGLIISHTFWNIDFYIDVKSTGVYLGVWVLFTSNGDF